MEKSHLMWVYLAIFLAVLVVSFLIVSPFLLSIVSGIIIAYFFYPVFKLLNRKIKRKALSAFVTSVLIILVFTAPLVLTIDWFGRDAYVSYILIKQKISGGIVSNVTCAEAGFQCAAVNYVSDAIKNPQFNFYINDMLNKAANFVVDRTNDFIASLPQLLLDLIIVLFTMYYVFKDGEGFVKKLEELIPLKEKYKARLVKRMDEMLKSTMYGNMMLALIQGITAALGYYLFGLNSVLLLAILTTIAAFVPVVGAIAVWLPVSLWVIIDGIMSSLNKEVFNGIGLLIYGAVIVSTLDNFIKPMIIGDRAHMHPLLVLLGILGGIAMFGIIGILLGPLVLAVLMTFIEIYQEESVSYEL